MTKIRRYVEENCSANYFERVILLKNLKKVLAVLLCLITVFSVMSISVSAANYTTNYSRYNSPENSGDYAKCVNTTPKKSSSTTTDEVRWMQAALNYCIGFRGLDAKMLDVDGSFGPKSRTATTAFQKAVNKAITDKKMSGSKLTVDGSFGPATIKAMKKVINDSFITFKTTVSRPTTSTTTTTTNQNTTTTSNFVQQNILQVDANSSSEYISGNWFKYYKGKCTCNTCQTQKYEYGKHQYISGGGCGIVSLISAIYNLGGTISKDNIGAAVKNVLAWSYDSKTSAGVRYWQNGVKSYNLFTASDDKFGSTYHFSVSKQYGSKGEKVSLDSLVNHIKSGGTAVVHVEGHFMAVVDYKVENNVTKLRVFDPAPGSGTKWNSRKRSGITSPEGNWFSVADLKNDGGTKGNKGSKENIEIDVYWLVSKR